MSETLVSRPRLRPAWSQSLSLALKLKSNFLRLKGKSLSLSLKILDWSPKCQSQYHIVVINTNVNMS